MTGTQIRIATGWLALAVAAAVWLPSAHLFFKPRMKEYYAGPGIPPRVRALAASHLDLWATPEKRAVAVAAMRRNNAEWDFMGRTFLVLALANMGLRDPSLKETCLPVMDNIIDETLRLEKKNGLFYFLMDYARDRPFLAQPQRSIFEDGEIALMLAARRMLEEKEDYRRLLGERVELVLAQMRQSPALSGESYPDECWTFCNAMALTAIRMTDALDGTDHSAFIRDWLFIAKQRLMDRPTGLLISCFAFDGSPLEGPEGSTIWLVSHCLQILDPEFAEDQYLRAKRELAGRLLGFGYAREWPQSRKGLPDIDSGPVIPGLEISAGSSGLAILGAAAFGDTAYLSELLTALNYGGFPVEKNGRLRFMASNQVGDAVILYALVQGPLWSEVEKRSAGK